MVRVHPDPPIHAAPGSNGPAEVVMQRVYGGVAQLGEHLLCKQGVIGSIPFTSTIRSCARRRKSRPAVLQASNV